MRMKSLPFIVCLFYTLLNFEIAIADSKNTSASGETTVSFPKPSSPSSMVIPGSGSPFNPSLNSPPESPGFPDFSIPSPASVPKDFALKAEQNTIKQFYNPQLNRAIQLLDSGCARDCGDPEIAGLLVSAPQGIYQKLYDKIKHKGYNCHRELLLSFSSSISMVRMHKDCLDEQYKTHPFCNGLNAPNRFSQMANLVYGPEVLSKTEAKAPCLECIIAGTDDFQNISQRIRHLEKTHQCRNNLPAGKEKAVFPANPMANIPPSYNVKRQLDGSYSISLRLQFSASKDYDGDVPAHQVHSHYMARVKKCMDQVNQKMLGKNGEKLKIDIQEKTNQAQDQCNDNTISIQVGSKEHRSTPIKFQSDIECRQITHEIFHLLGLCDDYKEVSRGHYVNPKTGERLYTGHIKTEEREHFAKDKRYQFMPLFECRATAINSVMSNIDTRWNNVFENNTNDSLLTEAQFNSILYGDCKINKFFNACSQLSTQDPWDTPDCIEKRNECEKQNFLGLDKKAEQSAIKAAIEEHNELIKDWTNPSSGFKEYEEGSYKRNTGLSYEQALSELHKYSHFLEKKLKIVESWPDEKQ